MADVRETIAVFCVMSAANDGPNAVSFIPCIAIDQFPAETKYLVQKVHFRGLCHSSSRNRTYWISLQNHPVACMLPEISEIPATGTPKRRPGGGLDSFQIIVTSS